MMASDFGGALPDDTTLADAREIISDILPMKKLTAIASVRKLRVRFMWGRAGAVEDCPDTMTLGAFRSPPPGVDFFITVDDGSGGMPVSAPSPAPTPELV